MNRLFLALAGFFGASGISLGALAAHALSQQLSSEQLEVFKLGVQYQLYHTLALFGVAIWLNYQKNAILSWVGGLFTIGIVLFSGTLYAITYLGLPNIGTAPMGGIAFILGWLLLIVAAFKPT